MGSPSLTTPSAHHSPDAIASAAEVFQSWAELSFEADVQHRPVTAHMDATHIGTLEHVPMQG